MNKIDAIYLRVSSPQSFASSNQQDSLPRQQELVTEWRHALGFSGPMEIFADDSSGSNSNRRQLLELIDRIENNQIARLFMYDDSRLARKQTTFQQAMWLCLQHGVDVWDFALRRCLNWRHDDDRMLMGISGLVNEFFLDNLKRQLKDGKERVLGQGGWIGGQRPYGYERGPDKHLRTRAGEWEIVQRIWHEARTFSAQEIAKGLEIDRLDGKIAAYKNNRWTTAIIARILRNAIYTGTVVYRRKQWVQNAHPAAVSMEEFQRLQVLSKPLKQYSTPKILAKNPYTGVFRCGHHRRSLISLRLRNKSEYVLT